MAVEWRREVRCLARERAQQEARHRWRIDASEAIPFDYRWEHVQSVVGLALALAEELGADREIVEAAAWLHDICKLEKDHEVKGAEEAEQLLAATDFPTGKIPAVAHAIRVHPGLYRNDPSASLEPLEAAILWDADKLTKLGVQSVIYNTSAPYLMGQSLQERRLNLLDYGESVLRRTVESMNTVPGRHIAERRYQAMRDTLAIWAWEEQEGATGLTQDAG